MRSAIIIVVYVGACEAAASCFKLLRAFDHMQNRRRHTRPLCGYTAGSTVVLCTHDIEGHSWMYMYLVMICDAIVIMCCAAGWQAAEEEQRGS
jgi:hypothetical protein